MDKKITIVMIAIIVAVVAIGAFLTVSNTFIPESSEYTDLFDYSIEPTTSWNADKSEYSFNQSIKSVNGKDYKNIEIKVNFYKGNNLLDSYESKINSTKDGKFNLKFTKDIYHEDDEFTPLLLLKAESLIATRYKAYWYRQRDCSITTNKDKTKVKQRLDNKRDIIFRLQKECCLLENKQKEALERIVSQLAMDYIYTTMIDTHDYNEINDRLDHLRQKCLYPLPNGNYTAKYKWFRAISSNRAGISLLTQILPLLKRER